MKPKIGDYWYRKYGYPREIVELEKLPVQIIDIQERKNFTIEEYEAQDYYLVTYKCLYYDTVSSGRISFFVNFFEYIGQQKDLEIFLNEEMIRDIIE